MMPNRTIFISTTTTTTSAFRFQSTITRKIRTPNSSNNNNNNKYHHLQQRMIVSNSNPTSSSMQQIQQQRQYQPNLYSLSSLPMLQRDTYYHPIISRCTFGTKRTYTTTNAVFDDNNSYDVEYDDDPELKSYYNRPVIQWYPGHIAKAERMLQDTFFKAVDVVVEVRDARAILATSHPNIPQWSSTKPRIIAITHVDMIPPSAIKVWKHYLITSTLRSTTENEASLSKMKINSDGQIISYEPVSIIFVNAQRGEGIHGLKREIEKTGDYVNDKLQRRGLNTRPIRVGIIGYPNVGKSSLINRLLGGTKRAKAANTPGVTRSLQWIRIASSSSGSNSNTKGSMMELLDSPGVIPASFVGTAKQQDAMMLAICNCIGLASYDNQLVAAFLCQYMINYCQQQLDGTYAPQWRTKCIDRYKFDPLDDIIVENTLPGQHAEQRRPRTGEDMLYDIADTLCQGNLEDAARKIIQDYRTGRMGPICLQAVQQIATTLSITSETAAKKIAAATKSTFRKKQQQQVPDKEIILEVVKERGIELPPSVVGGGGVVPSSSQRIHDEDIIVHTNDAEKETINTTGSSSSSSSSSSTTTTQSDEQAQQQQQSPTTTSTILGKGLFDGW